MTITLEGAKDARLLIGIDFGETSTDSTARQSDQVVVTGDEHDAHVQLREVSDGPRGIALGLILEREEAAECQVGLAGRFTERASGVCQR